MADDSSNQTVGLRFTSLSIPQGVQITNAYVEFTVDETDSGSCSLTIEGEDVDDAAAFTTSSYNISSRTPTSASVSWIPPDWTSIGSTEQTPELKTIIQEIVDRGGWASGNDLVLIITGSGTRTAESYNGTAAPVLHVEYEVPWGDLGNPLQTTGEMDIAIAEPNDDAEEAQGGVNLTSSRLEIVDYSTNNHTVGLRFASVNIPTGMEIINAYIEFEAYGSDSGSCDLTIEGEDVSDALSFNNDENDPSYPDNISSRTRTSASVAWSPPAWSSGNFYQTPDLKSIVQEIIDRSDWQTGNALAFIITGSGTRKAKSYDGSGEEPVLHIEYQVPGLGNDFEEDTDCVALWRMEDGALITDSIGTHTLTNSGAVSDTNTFVEDLGSADFECSESDTMVIADSDLDSDFPLKNGTSNNQFSVCFWTQLESLPGDQYLISKYDATNNKRSFAISVDSSGYISHAIGTSGGSSAETNTSTTALSTGTWYHVGATFDDSDKSWSLKVWDYDAESVVIDMSGVNTNNINIEDANWVIGGTDDGSGYLDGLMDEVVVFKDVLTSDEIDEIRAGVYTAAPWSGIVYTYDPSGRRINKNVDNVDTSYAYDGGHCIAEYGESGDILRKYIYGPGTDNPILMIEVQDANAEYYYHRDGLGNVVALSNADGNTVQTYDYSIYGLPAAADANHPNPYLFTGRRFDFETGLYYYRARMYHPNIGRFLQTDPIGYGDGMNWYAYCGNNPANCTDPSGMVEYDYRLTRVPYYYTVGGIPGVSEFIMMEITRHGRSVVQTLLFTNLGYVLDVLVSGQYKAGSGFPFPVEQNVDISEYIPSDWGKRFSHWKIARKNPRIFFALDLLLKLEVFSIDQYDSIQDSVRIEIRHGVTSYSGQGAGRISNSYWGVVWNDQQTDVFENMRSNPQNGIIGHWDWQGVRSIAVLAHELAHYWLPFGDEENAIIVENHARFAIWQLDPSTHSTLYPRPLNGYVGPGGNPNAPNLRRYPWDAWPVYIESMESR